MKKVLFLSLVAGLALVGCGKKPQTSFTASSNMVFEGENVTFTANSTDAKGAVWTFGDGTRSDEESPMHKWEKAGDYLVEYSATKKKKGGKSESSSQIIHVLPVADLYEGEYNVEIAEYDASSATGDYDGYLTSWSLATSDMMNDRVITMLPGMDHIITGVATLDGLTFTGESWTVDLGRETFTTPTTFTVTAMGDYTYTPMGAVMVGADGSLTFEYKITEVVTYTPSNGTSTSTTTYKYYKVSATKK